MKMNCIIVEDEPLALERAKAYALKLPYLHVLATFDNGIDALMFLKENPVDLIFLDINLGELSGIQLLEAAKLDCEVIITTAYHEYALKGFELQVTDYLLKPYTFERFLQAVEHAQTNRGKKDIAPDKKFIFIKTENRLEKLLLSELLYIEGMRDYRRIHTASKRIMTLQTFGELKHAIPPSIACRVHKSWMVALDKIDSIERDRIVIGGERIPISESYRGHFFALIGGR
jgi:two-component system, LytTR family, response regulator